MLSSSSRLQLDFHLTQPRAQLLPRQTFHLDGAYIYCVTSQEMRIFGCTTQIHMCMLALLCHMIFHQISSLSAPALFPPTHLFKFHQVFDSLDQGITLTPLEFAGE